MATNFFLAWSLGPTGKGIVAVLVLVPSLLVIIGGLGFQTAGVYYANKQRYPAQDIFATTLVFTLAMSLIIFAAVGLMFPWLQSFVYVAIPIDLVIISLGVYPLYLVAYYFGDIFLGLNHVRAYTVVRLLPVIIYSLLSVIFVGVAHWGAYGAILAFAMGIAGSGIAALILAARIVPLRLRMNGSFLVEGLRFGLKAHVGTLAQYSNYRADLFLVNYLVGLEAAGFYSVASSVVELLWFVPKSVGLALFPRISSLEDKAANLLTPLMMRNTLLLSVGVALTTFILSGTLITTFLPSYIPALVPLWLFLPGGAIASIYHVAFSDLTGRGKPLHATAVMFVGLLVGLVFYFLLIPPFGIAGAALASSLAYAAEAFLAVVILTRVAGLKPSALVIPTRQDLLLYKDAWGRFLKFGSHALKVRRQTDLF